jgi:hypothetical protein
VWEGRKKGEEREDRGRKKEVDERICMLSTLYNFCNLGHKNHHLGPKNKLAAIPVVPSAHFWVVLFSKGATG